MPYMPDDLDEIPGAQAERQAPRRLDAGEVSSLYRAYGEKLDRRAAQSGVAPEKAHAVRAFVAAALKSNTGIPRKQLRQVARGEVSDIRKAARAMAKPPLDSLQTLATGTAAAHRDARTQRDVLGGARRVYLHLDANDPMAHSHVVLISSAIDDITRMSTQRKWTTCMDVKDPKGHFEIYVPEDIQHGTLAAYLVRKEDPMALSPVARILLKPYYNAERETIVRPSTCYPFAYAGFENAVHDFAAQFETGKKGLFTSARVHLEGLPLTLSLPEDPPIPPTERHMAALREGIEIAQFAFSAPKFK